MAVLAGALPDCFDENDDELCPLCGAGSLHQHDCHLKRAGNSSAFIESAPASTFEGPVNAPTALFTRIKF